MNTIVKYIPVIFLFFSLAACESKGFDSDTRQIIAKDAIRGKVPRSRQFNIYNFSQDTLNNWQDSSIKKPIRYSLDFVFKDSTGAMQQKRGEVVFAPDSYTVIDTQIK